MKIVQFRQKIHDILIDSMSGEISPAGQRNSESTNLNKAMTRLRTTAYSMHRKQEVNYNFSYINVINIYAYKKVTVILIVYSS